MSDKDSGAVAESKGRERKARREGIRQLKGGRVQKREGVGEGPQRRRGE